MPQPWMLKVTCHTVVQKMLILTIMQYKEIYITRTIFLLGINLSDSKKCTLQITHPTRESTAVMPHTGMGHFEKRDS